MSEEIALSVPQGPEESSDTWAQEKLNRDKQRKNQRAWLFWGMSSLCCVLYVVFLSYMIFPERLAIISCTSAHHLWLVSLLGVIPTVLLLALVRSVYRSTKGDKTDYGGIAGEIAKILSAIASKLK